MIFATTTAHLCSLERGWEEDSENKGRDPQSRKDRRGRMEMLRDTDEGFAL